MLNCAEDGCVRRTALVFENCVDDGKRRPVPALDMEREHLLMRCGNAAKRPVNTNTFGTRSQPDTPLARNHDDPPVVTDVGGVSASVGVT